MKIDEVTPLHPMVKTRRDGDRQSDFSNAGAQAVTRQYRCALVDPWGREEGVATGEITLPAAGKDTENVVFPLAHPLAVTHQLVVSLRDGANEVETRQAEVTCPELNLPDDDYLAFTWPTPGNMTPQWNAYSDRLNVDYCGFNLCFSTYNGQPRPPYQKFFNFGCVWAPGTTTGKPRKAGASASFACRTRPISSW